MLNEQEFLKLIGDSIRKLRTNKRISSEKLAELSEMDYSSVNLIENQKQNPRSYSLYKLLLALDIDITSPLKGTSTEHEDVKTEIIKKLDLMPISHLHALLRFIEEFEIKTK